VLLCCWGRLCPGDASASVGMTPHMCTGRVRSKISDVWCKIFDLSCTLTSNITHPTSYIPPPMVRYTAPNVAAFNLSGRFPPFHHWPDRFGRSDVLLLRHPELSGSKVTLLLFINVKQWRCFCLCYVLLRFGFFLKLPRLFFHDYSPKYFSFVN
jgi:hypothetical protein